MDENTNESESGPKIARTPDERSDRESLLIGQVYEIGFLCCCFGSSLTKEEGSMDRKMIESIGNFRTIRPAAGAIFFGRGGMNRSVVLRSGGA